MAGSKGECRKQGRWQEARERAGRNGRGRKGREEEEEGSEKCYWYSTGVHFMYSHE